MEWNEREKGKVMDSETKGTDHSGRALHMLVRTLALNLRDMRSHVNIVYKAVT